jgi:hypothetical protein
MMHAMNGNSQGSVGSGYFEEESEPLADGDDEVIEPREDEQDNTSTNNLSSAGSVDFQHELEPSVDDSGDADGPPEDAVVELEFGLGVELRESIDGDQSERDDLSLLTSDASSEQESEVDASSQAQQPARRSDRLVEMAARAAERAARSADMSDQRHVLPAQRSRPAARTRGRPQVIPPAPQIDFTLHDDCLVGVLSMLDEVERDVVTCSVCRLFRNACWHSSLSAHRQAIVRISRKKSPHPLLRYINRLRSMTDATTRAGLPLFDSFPRLKIIDSWLLFSDITDATTVAANDARFPCPQVTSLDLSRNKNRHRSHRHTRTVLSIIASMVPNIRELDASHIVFDTLFCYLHLAPIAEKCNELQKVTWHGHEFS